MNKVIVLSVGLLLGLGVAYAAQAAYPGDVERLLQTGKCRRCDLSGADLSNANLRDAELQEANLEGANLSGANLEDTDFDNANLRYVNFKNAIIRDTDFSSANLQGAMIDYQELERGDAKVCNAIMPNGSRNKTSLGGFFGFGGCR